MSDTPKTDAKAQFFGFNPDEGEEFVQADFARELERENAALRADKERLDSGRILLRCHDCSQGWQSVEFIGQDLRAAIMRQHLSEGGTPT